MFGTGRPQAGESAKRIKGWTREILALPESATVMVTELSCSEPGCPPVETVIAVLRGPGASEKYKVHRPAADVTRDEVARLLAGGAS